MTNDQLYMRALKAIEDFMRDTSVSQDETRAGLQGIQDEIYIMLDSLHG